MKELPTIGKEYLLHDSPVEVLRVIECVGAPIGDAIVEYKTRFSEYGECRVAQLREPPLLAKAHRNRPPQSWYDSPEEDLFSE